MARIKICHLCQFRNNPDEINCQNCGVELTAPPTDERTSAEVTTGAVPERKQRIQGTVQEELGTAACAALEFPWGKVPVTGRLPIGRDPEFSPIANCIEENLYVSGRHAEVYLDEDGFLYVRHIGTSNLTYVNGKPIQPGVPMHLADADEVGFSQHLTANVQIG